MTRLALVESKDVEPFSRQNQAKKATTLGEFGAEKPGPFGTCRCLLDCSGVWGRRTWEGGEGEGRGTGGGQAEEEEKTALPSTDIVVNMWSRFHLLRNMRLGSVGGRFLQIQGRVGLKQEMDPLVGQPWLLGSLLRESWTWMRVWTMAPTCESSLKDLEYVGITKDSLCMGVWTVMARVLSVAHVVIHVCIYCIHGFMAFARSLQP